MKLELAQLGAGDRIRTGKNWVSGTSRTRSRSPVARRDCPGLATHDDKREQKLKGPASSTMAENTSMSLSGKAQKAVVAAPEAHHKRPGTRHRKPERGYANAMRHEVCDVRSC